MIFFNWKFRMSSKAVNLQAAVAFIPQFCPCSNFSFSPIFEDHFYTWSLEPHPCCAKGHSKFHAILISLLRFPFRIHCCRDFVLMHRQSWISPINVKEYSHRQPILQTKYPGTKWALFSQIYFVYFIKIWRGKNYCWSNKLQKNYQTFGIQFSFFF